MPPKRKRETGKKEEEEKQEEEEKEKEHFDVRAFILASIAKGQTSLCEWERAVEEIKEEEDLVDTQRLLSRRLPEIFAETPFAEMANSVQLTGYEKTEGDDYRYDKSSVCACFSFAFDASIFTYPPSSSQKEKVDTTSLPRITFDVNANWTGYDGINFQLDLNDGCGNGRCLVDCSTEESGLRHFFDGSVFDSCQLCDALTGRNLLTMPSEFESDEAKDRYNNLIECLGVLATTTCGLVMNNFLFEIDTDIVKERVKKVLQ